MRIVQNKTLSISVTMPLKQQTKEVKVIRERAPNVDTATASSGLEINEDVLRFTLKGHRLLVQTVSNTLISDPALPNAAAVRGSQRDAILAVLPVEAYSKDGAPVVEVSRLFTTELGGELTHEVADALQQAASYLGGWLARQSRAAFAHGSSGTTKEKDPS